MALKAGWRWCAHWLRLRMPSAGAAELIGQAAKNKLKTHFQRDGEEAFVFSHFRLISSIIVVGHSALDLQFLFTDAFIRLIAIFSSLRCLGIGLSKWSGPFGRCRGETGNFAVILQYR